MYLLDQIAHVSNNVNQEGGASTSHAREAVMSTQAGISATPLSQQGVGTLTFSFPLQAFLVELNSLEFEDLMDQILVPSSGYMLKFGGIQFDVDLNEPNPDPS
ncbi:hypothetical protein PIB30_015590 [Stylosanthes scabra]|uniref:Uncharacterized protein n=1 Tax=Stylosanthes scabra TaxID=79078 RepID=A0ABU6R7B7_9FABA|nr:hypothetical protein [Stylosanthes scabra]